MSCSIVRGHWRTKGAFLGSSQCVLFGAGFWGALWPAVCSTSPQTSSQSGPEGGLPASLASRHISDLLHCSVSHGCALSAKVSVSGLVAGVLFWFIPCLGFLPQLWGSVCSPYMKFLYFLDFSLPLSSQSPVTVSNFLFKTFPFKLLSLFKPCVVSVS